MPRPRSKCPHRTRCNSPRRPRRTCPRRSRCSSLPRPWTNIFLRRTRCNSVPRLRSKCPHRTRCSSPRRPRRTCPPRSRCSSPRRQVSTFLQRTRCRLRRSFHTSRQHTRCRWFQPPRDPSSGRRLFQVHSTRPPPRENSFPRHNSRKSWLRCCRRTFRSGRGCTFCRLPPRPFLGCSPLRPCPASARARCPISDPSSGRTTQPKQPQGLRQARAGASCESDPCEKSGETLPIDPTPKSFR